MQSHVELKFSRPPRYAFAKFHLLKMGQPLLAKDIIRISYIGYMSQIDVTGGLCTSRSEREFNELICWLYYTSGIGSRL